MSKNPVLPIVDVKNQQSDVAKHSDSTENANSQQTTSIISEPDISKKTEITDENDQLSHLKQFIADQFQQYSSQLNSNSSMVKELSESIQELKREIQEIKKVNVEIITENKFLKSEIVELKAEITELQQYSRRTNLEISGLPEVEHENINTVLNSVFSALNLNNADQIIAAHRVPSKRKDRPKSIIVQFSTKAERE